MSVARSRYYRIITGKAPIRWDFLSNEARNVEPKRPLTTRDQDRWRGISVFNSFEAAATRQHESPLLGSFIAEVTIPTGAEVRIEQTSRNRSHFTLWADPDDLLGWVSAVKPSETVD